MREFETYAWLLVLISLPFVAWAWHHWTTKGALGRWLDIAPNETSLRDNSATSADTESDSRCNSFTK